MKSNSNTSIILSITLYLIVRLLLPTNNNKESNLVKEFAIPATVGTVVVNIVEASGTALTCITILGVLATGGAGLVAAAGRPALTTYLKQNLRSVVEQHS